MQVNKSHDIALIIMMYRMRTYVHFIIIISFYLKQTRDLKIGMLHGLFFVISVYFLLS